MSLEEIKGVGALEFERSAPLFSPLFPSFLLPFPPSKPFRDLGFDLTNLENHSDEQRGTRKRFGAASQFDNLLQKKQFRRLRSISSPAREKAKKLKIQTQR